MGWTIDRHGERTENTPHGESGRGSENRGGEGDGRNISAGDEIIVRNRATIGKRRIEKIQEIRDRVWRREAKSTVRGPAGGTTNRGTGSDEEEDRSQSGEKDTPEIDGGSSGPADGSSPARTRGRLMDDRDGKETIGSKGPDDGKSNFKGRQTNISHTGSQSGNRPMFVHQGTVLGEIAEIEEDMVEFEGMVETKGFRKLTKEAETEGGSRETRGTGESFPVTRTWISESRFPRS